MGARYISLEGADGVGKTTQLKLLLAAFTQAGVPYCSTKEPGGTPVADQLRAILITGSEDKLSPVTEAFLMSASRCELMRDVVRPALARGEWVISDRTFLSTLALQGYGRGLDKAMLMNLTDYAIGETRPDLQVILTLPAEEALTRKDPLLQGGLEESRFENAGLPFHQRTRQGYLDYAAQHPESTAVIDASPDIPAVHRAIVDVLNMRMGLNLPYQA